ncbi:MAG: amidophosphoribosyltransferase [Actinomycetota bacterium]|nr:amidophosphoribosyltransferase [Actinomycetota bacterium]
MTAAIPLDTLAEAVRQRVGGYLANTVRTQGRACQVCTGPASNEMCSRCASQRSVFGDQLAARIFTLTYAQGNHPREIHQSAHTLRSYKNPLPATECQQNLQLLVAAASAVHGDCMQQSAGRLWDSLTFVPSGSRRGLQHPVAALACQVRALRGASRRFDLDLGPAIADPCRTVRPDRFVVREEHLGLVAGQHVLLLDDTWTTGSKLQSAAVALRRAGAALVTGLCVARWCRWDWPDHAALLAELDVPYDARSCPAIDGICDRGLAI